MAASWIKVEVITPDKPEVFQLSEILNLDPDAVLGKLIRLWTWADQQTIDGNANCNAASVTRNAVDRITFVSGFADALIAVGWLADVGGVLIFPNFERHNGESSKKRALTNKRVTKLRDLKRQNNQNGNANSVTEAYQKTLPEVEEEEDLKDKTTLLDRAGANAPPMNDFSPPDPPAVPEGGGPYGPTVTNGRPPSEFADDDWLDEPGMKFPMSADWQPSPDFQQRAALWNRALDGPAPGYTPGELAGFVAYWQPEERRYHQVQWEKKFADSVLHERRNAQTGKERHPRRGRFEPSGEYGEKPPGFN
ncbi:DnaT-like ssDNA-binding domain-containing protein [Serratia sp. PAMC26656]|uniref:DnaT-like ssDNA-binding domain-containing protein n=1 Tax=Serratia sp. PAMC26656 TaxID=2775909 RepID=UPI0018F528C7|nr:DnaT-like ssDNA-binding domain-containing protein [Serratia sp. PAMC26656]MBJ7892507.1 hypothetical protein [Serratia sp. PAMC26656]